MWKAFPEYHDKYWNRMIWENKYCDHIFGHIAQPYLWDIMKKVTVVSNNITTNVYSLIWKTYSNPWYYHLPISANS